MDGVHYYEKIKDDYVTVLPDTNTTTGCGTEVTDIDGMYMM